jgi:hypothetical protein
MFMNTKSKGYGEDTGWKVDYRLSIPDFGHPERSLNTVTVKWVKIRAKSYLLWAVLEFVSPESS